MLPVQGILDFLREFALWPLSSCCAFSHLFLSSFSSLSSTLSLPQGDQRPQRKHLQALWSSICCSLAFGGTIPIGGERPGTSPGFASPGCGLCPQLLTCPAQPQCPPCPRGAVSMPRVPVAGQCLLSSVSLPCPGPLPDPCQEAQDQVTFQDPFQARLSCDPALALPWARRIFMGPS